MSNGTGPPDWREHAHLGSRYVKIGAMVGIPWALSGLLVTHFWGLLGALAWLAVSWALLKLVGHLADWESLDVDEEGPE